MVELNRHSKSQDLYAACLSENAILQANAYQILWQYLYRIAYQLVRDQPDADALAQDCAQAALVRAHQKIDECREPAAFRTWSRRIVSHLTIDRLRRDRRLVQLPDEKQEEGEQAKQLPDPQPLPEVTAAEQLDQSQLLGLLHQSPISARSQRVIVGRFFESLPDEIIAERESAIAQKEVKPSHVQVTRAKNIAKLRQWDQLAAFFHIEPNNNAKF